MEEILDRARESARMAADKADSDLRWFLTTGAYCLAGFIIFALGVSFVFSTRIAGDLTSRISKLAAELDHSVHALELASKGTAHASQQIATSATENASAITETLSIADNGRKESERGKAVVNQMAGAVREVYEANSTLESLIKVIDDIKSKTRVINDIVFETRLLSFNASIEAARAGVHGKGFAVVAEEVGKLAAVSGKASEEITKLLENSVQQVREVVTTTSQRVNSARESSQQCETVFTQMSEALEEINNAMRNMEQVTHQNSASSEELANQASALASETKNLATSTQLLRSIVGGKDDAETTARKTEDHHFHEEHVPHSESPGFADGAPAMTVDELTAAPARTNVKRTDIRWKAS